MRLSWIPALYFRVRIWVFEIVLKWGSFIGLWAVFVLVFLF